MPRVNEDTKRSRIDRVELLLQRHPDGLTEREVAETLNLERRTTHNYLQELDMEGKAYRESTLWFSLPRKSLVLRRFDLQPEEAMVLYLASRLFVKQSDQRHEIAELVLLKLAGILSSDMHLGDDLKDAAKELSQRPKLPGYEDIFRTIVRGYIYHRKVQLIYQPYRGEPFETLFSPYLMEPSAIGFATYAIGHSSIVNTIRTYKIERIKEAALLRDEYTVPTDFPGLDLLRNAWSIYYGDEVIRVMLRFHPEVAKRVRETFWHPSQEIKKDDQLPGYLLLSITVADTTDLKPWIRTWGANCEVLEPSSLRDELTGEARKLALLYGWHTTTAETLDRAGPDHSRFHDIFGG